MTKPSKLYERLLANPNLIIGFRDFIRVLEAFGFVHKRTTGSHRSYRHSQIPDVLTIQPNGKEAMRYQVDRFLELVKRFDLHMAE